MKYLKTLLFFSLLLVPASFLHADELKPKLEKISLKIAATATAKGLSGATLAVFPLQADEKLEKKKVNFATGEILSHYLLKTGKFKIVERAQLETVMKEQKLGASGAVDSKTAAVIGKLLGAKLLIMGNVIKMGSSYQITVKLVDAETSEMITSEITEVPVEIFDKEASPYLVLVPEHQAIGIFFGGFYGQRKTIKSDPQTYQTLTLTPSNKDGAEETPLNFGIRYWFKPKYMVQLDYNFIDMKGDEMYTPTAGAGQVVVGGSNQGGYSGAFARLGVNRTSKLSEAFNYNAGVGFAHYKVKPSGDATPVSVNLTEYTIEKNSTEGSAGTFNTPFLRAGVEWKPQARFGWNLSANWNLFHKTYKQKITISRPPPNTSVEMVVWQSQFPSFYIDSSIALYF